MINEPEPFMALSKAFDRTQAAEEAARLPALTVFDRCDATDCSSQAYLQARETPPDRAKVLLEHADRLMAQTE